MTGPPFAEPQSTVQALDEDAVICVQEGDSATNKVSQDIIDLSGPSTATLVRKRKALPQVIQPQKGRRQNLPLTKSKSPPTNRHPIALDTSSDDEDGSLYTSDDLDAKDRKHKDAPLKKEKLSEKQGTASSAKQPVKQPSDPTHWTPEMERWLCDGYLEYQNDPKHIHAKVARYIMNRMPKLGGTRVAQKAQTQKMQKKYPELAEVMKKLKSMEGKLL
ncbi:uncharacterized protein SPPG_09041 [Spizellomyces punctatus DAOM BR117]|uniref:Uncharacterized protein n=1 Tax=Spizellomyces punctatus (strain DAOM BR117) TaxID=645134 RepID=A0A0L0HMU4_SPIPD|nr:uncharacterized protein SPPG_09041 [Spizellomyces punctatus DAOM BR117]KND02114.1 hypothetical protein SPPG_09041 [Spizellomyces punctatus DAOM BR117]|eukprot:XP_016610153.1 hypothetical protein SPPG_09041 [Spizellomyces punctatus DAOM BR117]